MLNLSLLSVRSSLPLKRANRIVNVIFDLCTAVLVCVAVSTHTAVRAISGNERPVADLNMVRFRGYPVLSPHFYRSLTPEVGHRTACTYLSSRKYTRGGIPVEQIWNHNSRG